MANPIRPRTPAPSCARCCRLPACRWRGSGRGRPGRATGRSARGGEAPGRRLALSGPGQAELDNELIVPVADAAKGERLLLGTCEDKNYRTIVAAAMANDHLVQSQN